MSRRTVVAIKRCTLDCLDILTYSRKHIFLVIAAILATLLVIPSIVSCGDAMLIGANTGSVIVSTSGAQALSLAEVKEVWVTVSANAEDFEDIKVQLQKAQQQGDNNSNTWQGLINAIPVGTERVLQADAYDSAGDKRYSGKAEDITITSGDPVAVHITLQQIDTPEDFKNSTPIIDALLASDSQIAPGARIDLTVVAHDPDADEDGSDDNDADNDNDNDNDADNALDYAWNAAAGTFSHPSSVKTQWTAPNAEGDYILKITVSDSDGAAAVLSFTVSVSASYGTGSSDVTLDINHWPQIGNLVADPAHLSSVGAQTKLTLTVNDADKDALVFAWASDCAGSFSATTAQSPIFTLGAMPQSGSCIFEVAVEDIDEDDYWRGGYTTGTLTITAGDDPKIYLAPEIKVNTQSAATVEAKDEVRLFVNAKDPQKLDLSFEWSATYGALGEVQTSKGGTSQLDWAAPTCIAKNVKIFEVWVDVSNEAGLVTEVLFEMTPDEDMDVCGAEEAEDD